MIATLALLAALHAQAPAQAPTGTVLLIGDSLTYPGHVADRVARRLPWLQWVGPKTTPMTDARTCGYGGYAALSFVDVQSDPFRDDPAGIFDMDKDLDSWGCPTIVVISLGTNHVGGAADATDMASRATTEASDIDTMIAEVRAECGAAVKALVTMPGQRDSSEASWDCVFSVVDPPRADAVRDEQLRQVQIGVWQPRWSGREAEGIYYMEYVHQPTGDFDHCDVLHPNIWGYEREAWQLAAMICTIVGGCQ